MPAAAVIPASVVYIKVVAVKKLVVGFLDSWYKPIYASRSVFIALGIHSQFLVNTIGPLLD